MPEDLLTFDADTHTYRLDGVRLPSVTQILKAEGYIDARWYTEEARERGQYVHTLTKVADEGDLNNPDAVEGWAWPYLEAWQKFLADTRCNFIWIEWRVVQPTFGFAGTVDRVLHWDGRDWVIDIKAGAKAAWCALQTAGYAICRDPHNLGHERRACVYLKPNGTYSLDIHENQSDRDVFLSAVAGYHWKCEHGVHECLN